MSRVFDASVKKQIQHHYDREAASYDFEELDEQRPENDYVRDYYLRKYLPKSPGSLVLDAGGGTGRVALPLVKLGFRVVLVDLSSGMLSRAGEKWRDGGDGQLAFARADLERLPFASGTFDAVICFGDVLSYCETELALAELTRTLKTEGSIMVGVDNRYALAAELLAQEANLEEAENVIRTGFCHYPKAWGGHLVRAFLPEELRQILFSSGVEAVEVVSRPYLTRSLTKDQRDRIFNDPAKTRILCELELTACKEPSLLGASSVLFAAGLRRERPDKKNRRPPR